MLTNFTDCPKCGAIYDTTTTCVSCAIKWGTIALMTQEVMRQRNCLWLGKEYRCEHLAS